MKWYLLEDEMMRRRVFWVFPCPLSEYIKSRWSAALPGVPRERRGETCTLGWAGLGWRWQGFYLECCHCAAQWEDTQIVSQQTPRLHYLYLHTPSCVWRLRLYILCIKSLGMRIIFSTRLELLRYFVRRYYCDLTTWAESAAWHGKTP